MTVKWHMHAAVWMAACMNFIQMQVIQHFMSQWNDIAR